METRASTKRFCFLRKLIIWKELLPEHISKNIIPYFKTKLHESNLTNEISLEHNDDKLFLVYTSLFNSSNSYLKDNVLIEFGAKNTIDPYEEKTLTTYLSYTTDILLPTPNVKILHPKRIFWEKATLMHVECNRKIRENKGDRLSRHWYDMYMLCQSGVKDEALKDIPLFHSVLEHKTMFFNNSLAKYDNCKSGQFRLIPDDNDIKKLTTDYNEMIRSGMFANEPPKFSQIIETLQLLESDLNLRCKS